MKKIIAIIMFATLAQAAPPWVKGPSYLTSLPDRITLSNGNTYFGPSEGMLLGDGWTNAPVGWSPTGWIYESGAWRAKTAGEILEEEVAAQVTASNAYNLAQQPAEFARGIAVPASGTNNPWMKIESTAEGNVFSYVSRGSPYDARAEESNRVAEAAMWDALRATNKQVRIQINSNLTAITSTIDWITTNITDMTSTTALTNNPNISEIRNLVNTLRSELTDANRRSKEVAQELKDSQSDARDITHVTKGIIKSSD